MKVYLPALRRPRIEMVPLIDSFFLLLAFFMSSVLTMEVTRGLPVDLPKASAGSTASEEQRRVVTVTRDGSVQLDGEPVTLSGLKERLFSDPARASLRVGIRADGGASYQAVVQVLAAVREAGVERVILLASPEGAKEVSG
ncbi:MAG: biopolymer transporter ExbD [Candidatus Omnitrophica bacterium]|nr:biopolymer transporter ExbD [Candidatus Omnitrophota bacterium]